MAQTTAKLFVVRVYQLMKYQVLNCTKHFGHWLHT